jgi:hypothetical protein
MRTLGDMLPAPGAEDVDLPLPGMGVILVNPREFSAKICSDST